MDAIHGFAREGEADKLLKCIDSGVPVDVKGLLVWTIKLFFHMVLFIASYISEPLLLILVWAVMISYTLLLFGYPRMFSHFQLNFPFTFLCLMEIFKKSTLSVCFVL